MAGSPESRRPLSDEKRETSSLDEYGRDIRSRVLAIQKKFDRKIAREIGYDGSIFDTFLGGLDNEQGKQSIVISNMPRPLRAHMVRNKDDSTKSSFLLYRSVDLDQDENLKLEYRIIDNPKGREVTLEAGTAKMNIILKEGRMKWVKIGMSNLHDGNESNFLTERTVELSDTSLGEYGVVKIGQKRGSVEVNPLVYTYSHESGKATMDLDQGMSFSGQAEVRLEENANNLTVEVENEEFYFPVIADPPAELAEISRRLGLA
jgi:hypothetical protein